MTVELLLKKSLIIYLKKNGIDSVKPDDIQTFVSLKAHSDAKGIFAININDEESLFVVSYFGHNNSFYIKEFDRVDNVDRLGFVFTRIGYKWIGRRNKCEKNYIFMPRSKVLTMVR